MKKLPAPTPRASAGFSIIEIMIVLAILGIIVAMAAPSLRDFIRTNRLTTTSGSLSADLAFARNESIRRNQSVLVCRAEGCGSTGTNWAAGWLICYDNDANGACDASTDTNPNPIRQRGALPTGLDLTGPSVNLEFHPNGRQGTVGSAAVAFALTGSWTSGANNTYTHSVANTGVTSAKKT